MSPASEPAGDDASLARAVDDARRADGFLDAVGALLARAEAELADLQPTCRACGNCCRFDEFGHRLYCSTGELALLTARRPPGPPGPPPNGRCPWQVGDRCAARDGRTLSCRAFFCDDAAAGRVVDVCERYHTALRRLHAEFAVPYRYLDLTAALEEIAGAQRR